MSAMNKQLHRNQGVSNLPEKYTKKVSTKMQLIFNIHAFSVETDHNYPQLTGLVAFQ